MYIHIYIYTHIHTFNVSIICIQTYIYRQRQREIVWVRGKDAEGGPGRETDGDSIRLFCLTYGLNTQRWPWDICGRPHVVKSTLSFLLSNPRLGAFFCPFFLGVETPS